jgi:hypothetical protein
MIELATIGLTEPRHFENIDAERPRVDAVSALTFPAEPCRSEVSMYAPLAQRPAAQQTRGSTFSPRPRSAQAITRQSRGGQALEPSFRDNLGERFNHDFGAVRIHSDTVAAQIAARERARALTVGKDIFFGAGEYQPNSRAGTMLLAHELAHVVQQQAAPLLQRQTAAGNDHPLEIQANRAAQAFASGGAMPSLTPVSPQLQRQAWEDDGENAADVAAPAVDGGGAASGLGLVARRVAFNNSGAPHADNCATSLPASLGAGIGGNIQNNMEMIWRIDGTIPRGTQFDILRARRTAAWQRDAAGAWSLLEREPAGTNDDAHNDDECLNPRRSRIFVVDTPGGPVTDVRGISTAAGATISAAATGFVWKLSFAERVIARNRSLGIGWQQISRPRFTFWHSIHSVAANGAGAWSLTSTPTGEANEIELGSTVTSGATP